MKYFKSIISVMAIVVLCSFSKFKGSEDVKANFTLRINAAEKVDSKLTLISEDEEDFISRTVSNLDRETSMQLRAGVKYALTIRTEGYVPVMQEFILSDIESTENFMHLNMEHVIDQNGEVIGEQKVIVVPFDGELNTMVLSKKTQDILNEVNSTVRMANLCTFSETRFYITANDYRSKVKEEGNALVQFDENSVVLYVSNPDLDLMNSESYHELIPSDHRTLLAINGVSSAPDAVKSTKEPSIPVSNANTVMDNEKLFFSVQLGAFSKEIKNPEQSFKTASVITHDTKGGQIKYYSGVYSTYEEANTHKLSLMEKGAADAFVAAFDKGEQISIPQAIVLQKQISDKE